ncbi:hypothetical protein JNB_14008 [Janibacter sp. HTCC2649]|uniref:FMN-binding protein n=1 Tax=Janibacter sp. HTCC2649 TaxID=313589 RepID=UPI0000671937|nr:FMN-binding protein [Janibacter sp. HTCC2649]EAP98084.1 hypothetical protein JNB_14008 [Janibacter sp. HTCC2649]
MRIRTGVAVGLGSAAVVGLSWVSGLEPRQLPITAGAQVEQSAVVVPASPATPSSSAPPTRSRTSTRPSASAPPSAPKVVSGTVKGAVIRTQYGPVQIRLSYSGKRITDIQPLQLTDSSGTSVRISNRAAPILRRKALAAQSAQVDMVSGASYTSSAYLQSLQSAIDAAHLG